MVPPLSSIKAVPGLGVLTLLCGALAVTWAATPPRAFSQAAQMPANNEALNGFLTKLKAQQDTLAANQTKIEAQIVILKEDVRQGRIFAARAGQRR